MTVMENGLRIVTYLFRCGWWITNEDALGGLGHNNRLEVHPRRFSKSVIAFVNRWAVIQKPIPISIMAPEIIHWQSFDLPILIQMASNRQALYR
jgi:hypothetical protein